MSYQEQLARIEAARAAAPKREYITNKEYAKLKGALTRAKNSGEPRKVLAAVEKAVGIFNAKTWPDDWSMWRIALEDASQKARMDANAMRRSVVLEEGYDDLMEASRELEAASYVLFRW